VVVEIQNEDAVLSVETNIGRLARRIRNSQLRTSAIGCVFGCRVRAAIRDPQISVTIDGVPLVDDAGSQVVGGLLCLLFRTNQSTLEPPNCATAICPVPVDGYAGGAFIQRGRVPKDVKPSGSTERAPSAPIIGRYPFALLARGTASFVALPADIG